MIKKREVKTKEITRLNPDYKKGLNYAEVEQRQREKLVNKRNIKVQTTFFKVIIRNIFTFFNIMLITIGVILIIFKQYTSCVFLIILFCNTAIGLFQDIRAKIAADKLSLVEDSTVSVIRDGKTIQIKSDELVLDDVVFLKNEDKVPCDSIVLNGEASLNESLLTGESIPSKKYINSFLYGGSYVTSGEVYAKVDKIGEDNYINKIQLKSKEFKASQSKMFLQLNKLLKVIGVFVVILGILDIILFGISGILDEDINFETIYLWLQGDVIRQLSGALVSIIPSGMYLLTSTALAVGVFNLAKKKVLVKDMYSQETLARVDTLCIDKTGTITDGNMSVFDFEVISKEITKERFKAYVSSYCKVLGEDNITSKMMSTYFKTKDIFEVTKTIHFSSVYKYSAVTFKEGETLVVGAYNYFELSNYEEIKKEVEESSLNGFRVLVVGLSKEQIKNDKLPKHIECIGIIRLQDHIRDDAKKAIKWFNDNDVNVKVISGDNPLTVSKIAEATGVLNPDKYISLDRLSDEEVKEAALKYSIFGRTSPDQKELIVKTLKSHNHTVAMIGDGINDILSLKSSDVSVALESGSKATKDIASLVLVDNDFTKLPDVIFEGRRVLNNLSRTCSLFLTKTVFAIFMNLFFLIVGFSTTFGSGKALLWPFAPNNFYCWELITIGGAAFFLALENNSERIKDNFLGLVLKKSIPFGVSVAVVTMLLYVLYLSNFFVPFGIVDSRSILNIATLFISLASFVPLFLVCRKFNLYRGIVFSCAILLSVVLYLWSIFGINWLLIYDPNETYYRIFSNAEFITSIILFGIYLVLILISIFGPVLFKRIKKGGK